MRAFVPVTVLGLVLASSVAAAAPLVAEPLPDEAATAAALRRYYTKYVYRIPMRDGAKLYTVAFVPKDDHRTWPILVTRTPYSCKPYGVDSYPTTNLRGLLPAAELVRAGYTFVQQDVRGRWMSEGSFVDVRPHRTDEKGVDESTDTWDTVDFLVHHVPRNNGNVGLWGISYPGFYASWGAVDAHPAVKAISPQAPVTDWFAGDDFHHNGAFFLMEAYMFMRHFGVARPTPVDWEADVAPFRAGDLYDYFLSVGTVAALDSTFLHGAIGFWNELVKHGTLDDFWLARDVRPYLKKVRPAVLTVGGWFDAEDLHGTLSTYHTIERQNPGLENELVMGPWQHGGWARHDGETLGDVKFDGKTSRWFASEVLLPFFERTLRGAPGSRPAEATVFETGTNEWRRYDAWPPKKATQATLWLAPHGHLVTRVPKDSTVESYVSDPARPVPYAERYDLERGVEYMDADQRYAARRPDVRTWTSAPLADEVVLAGPMEADLWISSTGTDADFVVKVVDVFPGDLEPPPGATSAPLAGRQQLVRLEVMRAKFRDSLSSPRALVPDEPTHVRFSLPDVSHAFRAGHRVMVQVQSSWFPIVDRNPQRFMDIYAAKPDDFHAETERVMEGGARASSLRVSVVRGVLP